jgi:hypothetical protein
MFANRSSHESPVMRSVVRTTPQEGVGTLLGNAARSTALYEWIIAAYTAWLLARAVFVSAGPERDRCVAWTTMLFLMHALTVFGVRSGLLGHGMLRGMATRIVSYGVVQYSYFVLRSLLPAAAPWSVDERLLQLDLRLFGFEPALAWDPLVSPATTEWFAFFYFSYFVIMGVHLFPILFGSGDDRLLTEFATGFLLVMCIGQSTYFLVPAFGPVKHLAAHFQHELPSGRFMDLVNHAVAAGGAQKDVFPSLHTGAPTFIALFSFRHRGRLPFTFSWPLVAFFAGNIVVATMFLRWHYLIDIVAGLLLASSAMLFAARVTPWELARRERLGLGRAWPALRS